MAVLQLGYSTGKKRSLSDIALGTTSSSGGGSLGGISSTKKNTVSSNHGSTDTTSQWLYKNRSTGEISTTPRGGDQFWSKYANPNYKAPDTSGNEVTNYSMSDALKDSQAAIDEAKQKTEQSKTNALGYLTNAENKANELYNKDLVSADELNQLIASRKSNIASNAQNLSSAFGDSDSGINQGVLRNIALNASARSANLPIETQLEINSRNRDAKTNALGYISNIAGNKASVEQNYQYDAGEDYIAQLGEALGLNSGSSGSSSGSSGSGSGEKSSISISPNSWETYKGKGTKKGKKTQYGNQLLNSDGTAITSSGKPIYV